MDIIYQDTDIVVCIKPSRVLSTDEPGGLPELLRDALGTEDFRTVHRLDRVVSGLMVVARNGAAASELSRQVREDEFEKEYLAVVHGIPEPAGTLKDLLVRDKARKMTMVTDKPGKDVQPAILHYQKLCTIGNLSRVRIQLVTGRTHQIRVQFASRGLPLVGERKYAVLEDGCDIALWSCRICFVHPKTGEKLEFYREPPEIYPWSQVLGAKMSHYDFFQNRDCEYFPCHSGSDPEGFNCLFCFCPLYALGDKCGGNFTYTDAGVKDCSGCRIPHCRENYAMICDKLSAVAELAKKA